MNAAQNPLNVCPYWVGDILTTMSEDCTGAALAGDDMGANHRLYAAGGRQYTPCGQYRRRVGSGADGEADAETQPWLLDVSKRLSVEFCRREQIHNPDWQKTLRQLCLQWDRMFVQRSRRTYAHREQVHGLLYVEAHRLTPKGVAV